MQITDLNSRGGIGSNCFSVKIGPFHFVIDAGIHPKEMGEPSLPRLEKIRKDQIDFIFLTHCHLDHVGALPVLSREHPEAPIICSHASAILAKRLMHNSCNVMEKQRFQYGIPSLPLYNHGDVVRTDRAMIPMHLDTPKVIESKDGDRLTFTLVPSGHIPGAAGILFEYHHRKILFSGDVMFQPSRILQGAKFPTSHLDTLVLETTRGSTERDPASTRDTEIDRLIETIHTTITAGGSVLIPVFALGRMQEMMTILHEATTAHKIPACPIYGSGLGMDIVNLFDQISKKTTQLNFRRKIVRDLTIQSLPEKHRAGKSTPSIYILSSGMMVEETPSYRAASTLFEDPHNAICIVGYCDPDTPGGKLLETKHGEPYVFEKFNKTVNLNAKLEKFDMSSHADREELLDYAIQTNPRSIVLSHGDPQSRDWFREQLAAKLPDTKVFDPEPLKPYLV